MKRQFTIGSIIFLGVLTVVFLAVVFYNNQSRIILGTNCGSYTVYSNFFDTDDENGGVDEKKKDVNECLIESFKTCTPSHVSIFGHGWEGGNDWVTKYGIVQSNGNCAVKVVHDETMSVGGKVQEVNICTRVSQDERQNLIVDNCYRTLLDCPSGVCPSDN